MTLTTDQKAHYAAATVLLVAAIICLLLAIMGAIDPSFMMAFIFGITAMIFAHYAFKQFSVADELTPPPVFPIVKRDERRFSIPLKSGAEATIAIEIDFETTVEPQFALDKIKARIQRCLRESFLETYELPDNPFAAIDAILAAKSASIRQELNLTKLSIRTVDVDPGVAPRQRTEHWK